MKRCWLMKEILNLEMIFMSKKELFYKIFFHIVFLILSLRTLFEEDASYMFKRYHIITVIMLIVCSLIMTLDNILNYRDKEYSLWLGTVFIAIELLFYYSQIKFYFF